MAEDNRLSTDIQETISNKFKKQWMFFPHLGMFHEPNSVVLNGDLQ